MTTLNESKFAPKPRKHPTSREERFALDMEDLTAAMKDYPAAESNIDAARAGHPGAQNLNGMPGGGSVGSPVERLLDNTGNIRDDSATARKDIDRGLRLLHQAATLLAPTVGKWKPRPADTRAKKEADILNHENVSCAHCTQHRAPGNAEPMFRCSDVGGRLDKVIPLGRWCYDFVIRTADQLGEARLPTRDEVKRNEKGLPVKLHAPGAARSGSLAKPRRRVTGSGETEGVQ